MNTGILVYSPEAKLREEFSSWGQHEDSLEVLIVDRPDALSDAIRSSDLAVVIVDDSDGALPLTALTHYIATRHPLARILVFPPSVQTNPSEIKDAILHGYLSKPFSADELNSALRGLPIPDPTQFETILSSNLPPLLIMKDKQQEISGDNESAVAIKSVDEDLDFLKGWLFEETEEAEPLPLPAIENGTEPENTQDVSGLPGEAGEASEPSPVETNDLAANAEGQTQVTTDATDTENGSSVAAITPAELQTLRSTFTQSLIETSVMEESSGQNQAGVPPVNLHSLRLHYSCVLIPRNPQHYLVGELADRLSLVLPQAHLKRGWRVTGTSIRPQYMQWFAALPLDTSPVEAVSEIRKLTSSCILTNLPELNNSAGVEDFWAPGYLILSGNLPTPASLIREFVQRTRSLSQSET